MHILLPVLGAIVVSATTSAASLIHPLNSRQEDPEDIESCPIGDGEDGEYEEDFYIREDCNLLSDDTAPILRPRAPTTGCPTVKVVKFPCDRYPNECKNMCFNRYCKGKSGNHPDLFHRGAVNSADDRRSEGGYLPPGSPDQPCNPNNNNAPRLFNEDPAWTSMDEFPMASFIEGGLHGDYGAGFRCVSVGKNKGAGSKMKNLLNSAGVKSDNTVSSDNEFDIEFINTSGLGVDWCNVGSDGKTTSKCENDGYQFIAKVKSGGGFDYLELKDGKGWTNTKP